MYEAFYGLVNKPFQLNPDPKFYYSSKQHQRARAYLEYGVLRAEGFIVITGEVGAGKTTIVKGLLESLDSEKVIAANLVSTQLGAEDTLRLVGAAFGINVNKASKSEILMALEAFFIAQFLQKKRCLLIVDEAQNLHMQAVEELRMLSNFQYDKHALLQTFLVGQPEFREILQNAEMLQLRQRISATCHLGPLDLKETEKYIRHRLHCAGAKNKPHLHNEIFEIIYNYTGGIPRRINSLMERVLLNGFLEEKSDIDAESINEIIEELGNELNVPKISISNDAVVKNTNTQTKSGDASENFQKSITENTNLNKILDGRLNRLEHSILRQEKISIDILMALNKILSKNI